MKKGIWIIIGILVLVLSIYLYSSAQSARRRMSPIIIEPPGTVSLDPASEGFPGSETAEKAKAKIPLHPTASVSIDPYRGGK